MSVEVNTLALLRSGRAGGHLHVRRARAGGGGGEGGGGEGRSRREMDASLGTHCMLRCCLLCVQKHVPRGETALCERQRQQDKVVVAAAAHRTVALTHLLKMCRLVALCYTQVYIKCRSRSIRESLHLHWYTTTRTSLHQRQTPPIQPPPSPDTAEEQGSSG